MNTVKELETIFKVKGTNNCLLDFELEMIDKRCQKLYTSRLSLNIMSYKLNFFLKKENETKV